MSNKPQSGFFSFLKKSPASTDQNLEESFYYEQVASMVGAGGWSIDFVNKKSYFDRQMKAILETPENYRPSLKHALHFFEMDYHDMITKSFKDLTSGKPVFDKVIKMVTYTNQTFWAHAISKPDLDKNNKIIGLKGVICFNSFYSFLKHEFTFFLLINVYNNSF